MAKESIDQADIERYQFSRSIERQEKSSPHQKFEGVIESLKEHGYDWNGFLFLTGKLPGTDFVEIWSAPVGDDTGVDEIGFSVRMPDGEKWRSELWLERWSKGVTPFYNDETVHSDNIYKQELAAHSMLDFVGGVIPQLAKTKGEVTA